MTKKSSKMGHKLSMSYVKNNIPLVAFIVCYIGVNVALFVTRAIDFVEFSLEDRVVRWDYLYMFARGSGERNLNEKSIWLHPNKVDVYRQSPTLQQHVHLGVDAATFHHLFERQGSGQLPSAGSARLPAQNGRHCHPVVGVVPHGNARVPLW